MPLFSDLSPISGNQLILNNSFISNITLIALYCWYEILRVLSQNAWTIFQPACFLISNIRKIILK